MLGMAAGPATAQTFTNLHNFNSTNDGSAPNGGLVLSGGAIYGTTSAGGSNGWGTAFALNISGSGFTNLHSFGYTNDGASPEAGLVLAGGVLYGTAAFGTSNGWGTVFALGTNGSGFTNLHNFNYTPDGAEPSDALILAGNLLYGTAYAGGANGIGTVFALGTNGSGFTNLHPFSLTSDGGSPYGGLVLAGGKLYGTTTMGGANGAPFGYGTVFALNTNGLGFTNLHNFNSTNDGAKPNAGLVLSGNTLFGTTSQGGGNGYGTVFGINTDGSGFTNLHVFSYTNDGGEPLGGLTLSGNTLYGTAYTGGTNGHGILFAINTDGSGFTNLHTFNYASDGGGPGATLALSGNTLYGTASQGGTNGYGTVFALSIAVTPPVQPQLSILLVSTNAILTWPTNAPGFTLQFTTSLPAPAWSNVSPGAVIVGGVFTVTNPVTGGQKYYRLMQ